MPGLTEALDEQRARDRAEVHSIGSQSAWHVVRTPQGWHVNLTGDALNHAPEGFAVVATYRDGHEVPNA